MSKQMNAPLDRRTVRRQLLVGVSSIALMAWNVEIANAADADHPPIWIELGGQAEAVSGQGQPFTLPFMTIQADSPTFDPVSPLEIQKPPRYSFGEEAAISFQPEDSKWIFSASVRYGRSSNERHVHQQTPGLPIPTTSLVYKFDHKYGIPPIAYKAQSYVHYNEHHGETHAILDFQAGTDVGLGLFGRDGTSVLTGGVRVARFSTDATTDIRARPDMSIYGFSPNNFKYQHLWHNYHLTGSSVRSFHGMGPTVSWSGSVSIVGNPGDGELAFDWGINAAALFGKQTAKVHHQSSADLFHHKYYSSLYHRSANPARSRSVTVPNVGGFAGVSYQFVDAKLSLGYRADYFFGAIDGGIDTAKKTTLGFNGPYASISIGMGD